MFSLKDNSIGIDPQHAEKIFVIFQRRHTREQYAGTGSGLAACRKIIERQRGKIWRQSELGKGATFIYAAGLIPPDNSIKSMGKVRVENGL